MADMLEWANDPKNLIVLPDRGQASTFARELYQVWDEQAPRDSEIRPQIVLNMDRPINVIFITF
jgi:hypothetical protein